MRKVCVINSYTGFCENIINVYSKEDWAPYKPGIELSPDDGGEIGWTWDGTQWIQPPPYEPTLEERKEIARGIRNKWLRRNVDSINGVRLAAMTAEKQAEWVAYRQALLDVPAQPGFPDDIVWPTKPSE